MELGCNSSGSPIHAFHRPNLDRLPNRFLVHFRNNYKNVIWPTVSQPGFFNLTSTFRSDSDFPVPYFHTQVRDSPCDHCLPNSTFLFYKTKLMVWIVSNCKTQSKREDYMAELSKYINVDVFGKCGNFTPECYGHWQHKCTNRLIKDYKFYFAAENSLCKEYFTGKILNNYSIIFRSLQYGLLIRKIKLDPTVLIVARPILDWISCLFR